MLKQLTIKNYKSQKNTVVDFHPGMNVFVGESQAGKSDILRAFLWLARNKPLAFRFKSWFAGKKDPTTVAVKLSDDIEIYKSKVGLTTLYRMMRGKENHEYPKFGDKVPDKIKDALNLSELNIQSQLDQFFLITATPQEVARAINRVLRAEKVDEVYKPKLTKGINTLTNKMEYAQGELDEAKAGLEEYNELPKMERAVRRMETVAGDVEFLTDQQDTLHKVVSAFELIERQIQWVDEYLESVSLVEEAEELVDSMVDDLRLGEALKGYVQLGDKMHACDQTIALDEIVIAAEYEVKNLDNIDYQLDELKDCYSRILLINEQYDEAAEYYEESTAVFEKLLKKAKVCPLCLSEIGPKEIKKIIEGK